MKSSPQRDDADAPASYPSGARLEELAQAAIRFFNERTTLVPVLWGPSSEGKTFFCRSLARKMDALFIHVILKSMKPDDVAGCQIMTPEGELRVALPWWFQQAREAAAQGRKALILLDELDKVDDDLFAPILAPRTRPGRPVQGGGGMVHRRRLRPAGRDLRRLSARPMLQLPERKEEAGETPFAAEDAR